MHSLVPLRMAFTVKARRVISKHTRSSLKVLCRVQLFAGRRVAFGEPGRAGRVHVHWLQFRIMQSFPAHLAVWCRRSVTHMIRRVSRLSSISRTHGFWARELFTLIDALKVSLALFLVCRRSLWSLRRPRCIGCSKKRTPRMQHPGSQCPPCSIQAHNVAMTTSLALRDCGRLGDPNTLDPFLFRHALIALLPLFDIESILELIRLRNGLDERALPRNIRAHVPTTNNLVQERSPLVWKDIRDHTIAAAVAMFLVGAH